MRFTKSLIVMAIVGALWVDAAFAMVIQREPAAASDEKKSPTTAVLKPPITPQDMWERILILLNTNGGFVSKQDVENTIGVRFTETEKDKERRELGFEYLHRTKQKLPHLGLLDMGMFDDPKRISLIIRWGDPEYDTSFCLNFETVQKTLEGMGWEGSGRSPMTGRPSYVLFYRPERKQILETLLAGMNDPLEIRRVKSDYTRNQPEIWVVTPYNSSRCVVGFDIQRSISK